jgi:hypothetical protein
MGGGVVVVSHRDVMTPSVAPRDPELRDLALVGVAAEQAGWPVEQAFEAAMLLRIHGTATHTSVEAFQACRKRRQ